MPTTIKFTEKGKNHITLKFKVLENYQFYDYLLSNDIIEQQACGHCNNKIQFENIYKITSNSITYLYSNDKICCSKKCSSKERAILYDINNPGVRSKCFKSYNESDLNKRTYEEKFGKEKSDEIKRKQSDNLSGNNNPNFGGKWHFSTNSGRKGKTNIEIYGKEKAEEIKQKQSLKLKGENNPMFGKESPIKSGNGLSGYYKDFYFRSLLELSYMLDLESKNITYEKIENNKLVNYQYNGSQRTYSIDFYLPQTKQYVEIKAKNFLNTEQNKVKFEAAKNQYGDKFIVLTEDDVKRIQKDFLLQLINNNLVKLDNKELCNKILK